jgi:hypothetical protein
MEKRFSISRRVVPASEMSQKQLHCRFVHEVQRHYQLLDGIPGPLHGPKRKNPVGLYWRSEGANRLVRPAQYICLQEFYSDSLSL